jgi:hypothetical protein
MIRMAALVALASCLVGLLCWHIGDRAQRNAHYILHQQHEVHP